MAMVYQAYCEEKELMSKGGVSRVLSQEAIALAPVLPFDVDINELLTSLGYKLAKHVDCAKALKFNNASEALEFFEFDLDEDFMKKAGGSQLDEEAPA